MITKEEANQLYSDLINLRRVEILNKDKFQPGKIETHHVLPISCGGQDIDINRINLYAKEHFMAYVYLWVIHHDDEFHNQTICALQNMIKGTISGLRVELREFILKSEEYQKAREEFAQLQSQLKFGEASSGANNSNYNKHWYYDPVTFECKSFYSYDIPIGWVPGRKYKNPDSFSQSVSTAQQNRIWIRKKDLTERHHITKEEAQVFLNSGDWELGKSLESGRIRKYDSKHKKYVYKTTCVCANCNSEFIGNAKYCCDECRKFADLEQRKKNTEQQHIKEVELLQNRGYFDSQSTELYRGHVNRKQVKRYFETIGKDCCDICRKNNCKLIVHSIDGNPKNLLISNFEYLCKDCYYTKTNNLLKSKLNTAYKEA